MARNAVAQGVQAIAILFLHSYRNPAHEQRAKTIVEREFPQLFVTASHELSQEYREYERTSTAAANAYVGPRVQRYLDRDGKPSRDAGFGGNFLIVQSTGGLFDVSDARRSCIRMLESGPAAGVVGTKALCDSLGMQNAIAFDMGGTTAKAGVIHEGHVLMTGSGVDRRLCHRAPVQMPMIDIQEVGTGGGSIARVEVGNALRVGPESAGACRGRCATGSAAPSRPSPMPISFSAGSAPTASSAARCRSISRREEGGRRKDRGRSASIRSRPRRHPADCDHENGARGALGDHRARARRRGFRARRLWRRGAVARRPRSPRTFIATVIIPRAPGHFSACGMLVADLRRDFVNTWFKPLADASFPEMETIFAEMERQGRATVAAGRRSSASRCGARPTCATSARSTPSRSSCRPSVQAQDRDGIKPQFDAVHQTRYGYAAPGKSRDRQPAQRRHRRDAKAAVRARSPRAARSRMPRRSAASGRFISPAPASSRRRLRTSPRSRPATGSPARR